jgi:hypothetical protein
MLLVTRDSLKLLDYGHRNAAGAAKRKRKCAFSPLVSGAWHGNTNALASVYQRKAPFSTVEYADGYFQLMPRATLASGQYVFFSMKVANVVEHFYSFAVK